MPPNRAAELLRRIHKETTEQAQMSLLAPFVIQALVALGLGLLFVLRVPLGIYVAGLITGESLLTGALIATMARLESVVAGGLARASLVEAARGPVLGRQWRIVGSE